MRKKHDVTFFSCCTLFLNTASISAFWLKCQYVRWPRRCCPWCVVFGTCPMGQTYRLIDRNPTDALHCFVLTIRCGQHNGPEFIGSLFIDESFVCIAICCCMRPVTVVFSSGVSARCVNCWRMRNSGPSIHGMRLARKRQVFRSIDVCQHVTLLQRHLLQLRQFKYRRDKRNSTDLDFFFTNWRNWKS